MVDKSSFLGCFNPCKFGFQNFSVNQVRPAGFGLFEQAFPNDMGECEECKTRFSLLRRKKYCHYCGLGYCSSCLTRFAGGQRHCRKCTILNCWPINKADISSLRVRDLRYFLNTCKVPHYTYREKQELVDLVIVQLKLRHFRLSHEYQRPFSSRQTNSTATSSTIHDDGIRVRPQSTNFEVPMPTTSNFGAVRNDFEATNHNVTGIGMFPSTHDHTVASTDSQSSIYQEPSDNSTSPLSWSNQQPEGLHPSSSSESLNQSGDRENVSTNIPPDNEEDILQEVHIPSDSGLNEEENIEQNDFQITDTPAAESKMTCVADIIKLSTLSDEDAIKELSVRQCKEVLTHHRVDFSGVWEKHELVNKVIMLWKDFKEKKGEKDWSEDQLCKICMDAAIDCVLLECGHMLSCTKCGKQMAECPICRQNVIRVLKTFRA